MSLEDLRVVLFGGKLSGKSSVINTVFGENIINTYSRTGQCREYQRTVNGTEVILVDTPGWWKHFPSKDTAESLKWELVHSVTLCPPGPHALLLVIELDIPFTEKHRKAMEDHLELLGGGVWAYSIVLFTRGNSLKSRNIEEHIENEGEALQWIIQKCEGRYHVFENKNEDNHTQVTELLQKIKSIRAKNRGGYFQIDQDILETAEEKRKAIMKKSSSRQRNEKEQRKLNKNELRIALLGWVIGGKSSAANIILNTDEFVTGRRTMRCHRASDEVSGRKVTVLDTPSWWKFLPSYCTPEWVKSEILQGVTKSPEPPHAILLVIPGDTSFKEEQKRIIQENMEMFGESVWRHTLVLFTWGDALGDLPIEQHIESEGKALQWVVNKCGNRYHAFDNMNKSDRSQVTELLEKIEEMVERNSSFQFSTEIDAEVYDADEDSDEEINSQTDLCRDETNLKDLVRLLDQEWNRRDDEFLKKLAKIWSEYNPIGSYIRKGNHSMDDGPFFSGEKPPKETCLMEISSEENLQGEASQEEPVCTGAVSGVDIQNGHPGHEHQENAEIQLPDHIKDRLDREWGRREEAMMGRLWDMLRACLESFVKEGKPPKEMFFMEETSQRKPEFVCTESGCNVQSGDPLLKNEGNMTSEPSALIKELIDREWNRREETMMARIREMLMLLKESYEASSEADVSELRRSFDKVHMWLHGQYPSRVSGYETASFISAEEDRCDPVENVEDSLTK